MGRQSCGMQNNEKRNWDWRASTSSGTPRSRSSTNSRIQRRYRLSLLDFHPDTLRTELFGYSQHTQAVPSCRVTKAAENLFVHGESRPPPGFQTRPFDVLRL